MKCDTYEYRIAGHFASAIINGDDSGLDEKESEQLRAFEAGLPIGEGYWSGFDEDTQNFTRCEVCGLHADTYEAYWNVPI